MPTAESESFVMPKVEGVTIERTFALRWSQNLTHRADGDRGSIEELAFRMYTLQHSTYKELSVTKSRWLFANFY